MKQAKCTPAAMDRLGWALHPVYMPGQRHFLREWRKHKGYTLERVAEHIGTTHATLSRIERGLVPYNQTLLELLADFYSTEPASLLMRNPADPDAPWSILDGLSPVQRRQIAEIAETLRKAG